MKKHSAWIPDFGLKGWGIVFLGICFYYIQQVLDGGLNMLFTTYNALYGWSTTAMASVITIGGWLAVVGIALFGGVCKKKGTKFVSVVGLAGLAVGLVVLGASTSFVGFIIGAVIFLFCASGFGIIGVGQYGADWFPTTKGMYMGMVTMGITAGSATINLVMNTLFPTIGVSGFMYLFAGIAVVLIVLVLLSKNTPEEAGAYPDNDKSMTREKVLELRRIAEEYKKRSPWTTKKVLKTKQTWLIAIGWGLPMMAAVGVMTNLVGTIASYGHDYMYGITLLSTMWPAGVLGNYLGGVVDEKFGTKTATLMVVALELIGAFITLIFGADKFLVAVGVALFMFAISACTNVCMSMTATVYGREDFENAWPVVQVIFRILQVSGVLFIASIAEGMSYRAALVGVIVIVAVGGVLVMLTSSEQIGSHVDAAQAASPEKTV